MQERLIYKVLLLKELVFSVCFCNVVIVVILAFFLFSPASLVVLASVLTAFILY
jgi:hypothetical protein